MTTFTARTGKHENLRTQVARVLRQSGFFVAPYGQEHVLPESVREKLRECQRDLTALYLRFQPDLIVIRQARCWLAEIKSRTSTSGNLSYELDSKSVADRLWAIGIPVFVVFPGGRTTWTHLIAFKARFEQPSAEWGGSHTPFGLLDDHESRLLPLERFIAQELLDEEPSA